MLMDAVSLVVAMITARMIHSALREHFEGFKSPPAIEEYLLLAYLTLPMWLALASVLGLYRQLERPLKARALFGDLVQLHVLGLLALTLLIYLTQIYLNRSVVALFLLLTFALMFASRLALHAWIRLEYRRGHGQQRVLLVTDSPRTADEFASMFQDQPLPPALVGCVSPNLRHGLNANWRHPVLGAPSEIRRVLHENAVDLVLVSCGRDVALDIDALLEACDEIGVPLRCHVRADASGTRAIRIVDDAVVPCIAYEARPRSAESLIVKRLLDVSVATLSLLAMTPIIVGIALTIWLTMGRPILVRQVRTGYNGRTFTMYKFRTMVRDADAMKAQLADKNEIGGPVFKMSDDPRTTPLGRLLRRSSLDEVPQFWNVLIGNMSLVGPRPLLVAEQHRISGQLRRRLSMKPGMTGLWQVSGRSDLAFDDWMQLDLQYVDNWSLRHDFQLLLRTIPAVVLARGAR
jgi:exopolysaccharide biosynthesis polyprenyl glycosylphosphotransferase